MAKYISQGDGDYVIDLTKGSSGVLGSTTFTYGSFENERVDMTYKLPKQVLKLVEVRVQMQTANDSLRVRTLKVKLPFLSGQHQLDNFPNSLFLNIPLGDQAITHVPKDQTVYMSKDAPKEFEISVYNGDLEIETRINSLTLVFKTEFGSI